MLGLDGSLVFLVSCFKISGADVSMTVEKFFFLNPYETFLTLLLGACLLGGFSKYIVYPGLW